MDFTPFCYPVLNDVLQPSPTGLLAQNRAPMHIKVKNSNDEPRAVGLKAHPL